VCSSDLSCFIVDINFESKIITLIKPEYFKPKKRYTALPITIEDTKPFLKVRAKQTESDEMTLKLMIDTGASHALLLEEESHENIRIPTPNIPSNIGRGLAGDLKGKIGRIESLGFGDFQFKGVITTFPETNSYLDSLKRGNIYRNGTLGGEVMSRFNIIFDYSDGLLYLKKNSKYSKRFEYNISGIIIKATGLNLEDFTIDEVRKGSAAELAGLQQGDEIIAVNNSNVKNLKLEQVIGYFNSKHNKLLKVDLKRDGVLIKKKFRLQRQI